MKRGFAGYCIAALGFAFLCIPAFTARAGQDGPAAVKTAPYICPQQSVHIRINGHSLSPLLPSGTVVDGLPAACGAAPRAGDLAVFHNGRAGLPLVKVVKAVPGDRFALVPAAAQGGEARRLEVNGVLAVNSEGVPYRFYGSRARMIGIYESGYHGVIPAGAFLVLGDDPLGTIDSGKTGLIHISDVIAVVPREWF